MTGRSRGAVHCGASGQALVEFALILPILTALSVGVADTGRAFYYQEAVDNAARQAARYAVQTTQQSIGDGYCGTNNVNGVAAQKVNLPEQNNDPIQPIVDAAALEASSDGTILGSVLNNAASPSTITVTWHCLGPKALTNMTATSNDPSLATSDTVAVQVTYSFKMYTPFAAGLFGGSPTRTLSDTVYERAEY
ncbi:MAG TPA: TadE/TadG family type IV pilus assembly protein [Candidatus Dormibacteraeota bacterium]|jgi:Flp pilus assembly protein TadG|nr:TadE/TadG family type IV pilus assembly protein [Candidatus Dormibacteraeota bacterium]